jgi:hypothetical protein
MKPMYHARITAKRHGGKPEDYQEIHDFMDSSKIAFADIQHRAILHSTFGIYIAEKIFGNSIINSDGKEIPVRTVAEQHVYDDMGWIPTPKDWLSNLELKPWMHGRTAAKKDQNVKSIKQFNLSDFKGE